MKMYQYYFIPNHNGNPYLEVWEQLDKHGRNLRLIQALNTTRSIGDFTTSDRIMGAREFVLQYSKGGAKADIITASGLKELEESLFLHLL